MKVQLLFSALILFAAALPKASAQSAEEEAIKKAVLSETKYYLMGDSVAWKATWLHDSKVTHTWASSGSYGVMIGWDSIKRRVIRSMVFNGPRDTSQLKNENYLIRVNGNLANGSHSLFNNTTGYANTASGVYALTANTTGYNNTAYGYEALYKNTTGTYNTSVGNYALQNNTTGYKNTAVGDSAGAAYSYTYSTFVGYKAPTSVSGLTNVTVIGNQASATASNQVRIGNTSVTSIGGKVGWSVSRMRRMQVLFNAV